MKVKNITIRKKNTADKTYLTTAGSGYLQGESGSLPDVDIDFQSDRRQDIKEYLERRYNLNGRQRVFSAGTVTTLKLKAVLKDVARLYGVPPKIANMVTKCIKDDSMSWTDLILLAYSEKTEKNKRKTVSNFIKVYPEVIADIKYIMGQPRSASIHASALIITPETRDGKAVDCFDYLPIKKMDNVLVSEIDGYSIDDIGLLKNDILGVKELSKIKGYFNIIKREYGVDLSIPEIASTDMDDPKAYEMLCKGFTQNVFQFSSSGMTGFISEMKPSQFSDLVAATSLFRPASLESGSAEKYNDCKHGLVAPTYLWGTHDILKDTYGVLCYQEQLAQMSREIGGFTIGEGVKLVKLISKKKTDKIHEMKDKFMDGAKAKGCPKEDAVKIWDMIESGGSYLFNRCISGDESIQMFSAKPILVSELYQLKCNGLLNDVKYAYSCDTHGTGEIYKNTIKDVRFAGERKIYRITLSNGSTIDVTDNHKNPTQRGEVMTSELIPNSDLMLTLSGVYDVKFSKVISVEYLKTGDVYDIEMFDPYHNYVTGNGIITCNSHATAYSVHSYIGAYVKAHYPLAFYTITLEYANDDDIPAIISEMEQVAGIKIVSPDINISGRSFFTDYKNQQIYWSLSRITKAGDKVTRRVIEDRNAFGNYKSMADFIERVFVKKRIEKDIFELRQKNEPTKLFFSNQLYETGWDARKYLESVVDSGNYSMAYEMLYGKKLTKEQYEFINTICEKGSRCPITSEHIRNFIYSGCFDNIEGVTAVTERKTLMIEASQLADFVLDNNNFPKDLVDNHYYWSTQQVKLSGVGSVDYKRVFDNSEFKDKIKNIGKYIEFSDIEDPNNDGKTVKICATISSIRPFTTKKGQNCMTITLSQNQIISYLTVWGDKAEEYGNILNNENIGRIIIGVVKVKYEDYYKENRMSTFWSSQFELI